MVKENPDNASGTLDRPGISKITAHGLSVFSLLLGGASIPAFMLFLYTGPLPFIDLGLEGNTLLLFDACLSLVFFLQHSGMTRKSFRGWMGKFTGPVYDGAIYSIISGTLLFSLMLLWQKSGTTLILVKAPAAWIIQALYFLCIAGFIWGIRSLDFFDPYGIRNIRLNLRGRVPGPVPFSARGPYRFMRHPLYAFFILMIWCNPHITSDRLLFNILWTLWIILGSFLEERDLASLYGDGYRAYQEKVPMLFPYRPWSRKKILE